MGGRHQILVARQCLALWWSWTLANMVGGAFALLLWRIAAELSFGLSLLFALLPLYVMQSLVLRRYLRAVGRSSLAAVEHKFGWVIASAVGVVAGSQLESVVADGLRTAAALPGQDLNVVGVLVDTQLLWARAAGLSVLGAAVAAAQWLMLRRSADWASLWILVSVLVGAASGTLALVVDTDMPVGSSLLAYGAGWGLYGALTGIALVLLLRDRIRGRVERRLERLRRLAKDLG
jgi:hypothetical protein